jgi:hypothetical protein
MTVPDRFWPFLTVSKTLRNAQKRSETLRNAQKRSERVRNGHGNGQERSGTVIVTVRNGERYETIILYIINGQKRLQNQVHGAFTFTIQKRKNHCISFQKIYLTIFPKPYSDTAL